MIYQEQNRSPFISFDFGDTVKSVAVDTVVTVWLNTPYNQDEYQFDLIYQNASKAMVTKISNYEFEISYNEAGTYNLSFVVSNKGKSKSLTSNTITLTVE